MKKILVIEDEQNLREDIIEILKYEDFDVVGSPSGSQGVKFARTYLPDLIICDIMMADMDGYNVLIEVRSDPATVNIPFIFLTARTSREDMRRGMELGADDYLTKPFSQPELIATISTRLEKHENLTRAYERRLNDLRENVIHALPHEMRTSLTGILSYAHMLKDEAEALQPRQVYQMSEGIEKAAQRLHRLTENYLLYAQIEFIFADPARMASMRENQTDSPQLFVRQSAIQKSLEYERQDDLMVEGINISTGISPESLDKIVSEITDNAFKFSQEGTPVEVTTRCTGDKYVLSITNYGPGMSAAQIASVGAYMQFDRRIYEQNGVGLGLTISRRLAELHGGTLEITSIPNDKTTVIIKLPLIL